MFFGVFPGFFLINMVATLMMSTKLVTLGLVKRKAFWNKGYEIIISLHDTTNFSVLVATEKSEVW